MVDQHGFGDLWLILLFRSRQITFSVSFTA